MVLTLDTYCASSHLLLLLRLLSSFASRCGSCNCSKVKSCCSSSGELAEVLSCRMELHTSDTVLVSDTKPVGAISSCCMRAGLRAGLLPVLGPLLHADADNGLTPDAALLLLLFFLCLPILERGARSSLEHSQLPGTCQYSGRGLLVKQRY